MCVYVPYQYELFASYGHNHRRGRTLIQRDYFVYRKRVAVFEQVQDIVGLVQYVHGSKPHANQFRNLCYADVRYSLNIEAVYLPSQRGYSRKQRDIIGSTAKTILSISCVSVHSLGAVQPCRIQAVLTQVIRLHLAYQCIGYLNGVTWEKTPAE